MKAKEKPVPALLHPNRLSSRVNDPVCPFSWGGRDQHDTASFLFYSCIFTSDFGPCRTGERVNSINVNFETGVMDFYTSDSDGTPYLSLQFRLVFAPMSIQQKLSRESIL